MRYLDIKPNDVINGKGIMVSVWFSGCHHHCPGCFQPETWSFDAGKEFTDSHFDYVLNLLDKNGIKRNLSILGGDPLCDENIYNVINFISYIKTKRPETIIYIWTGYIYEELFNIYGKELFLNIDYLIDGKFEMDKKDITLKLRGSSNQRVIDVQKTLRDNKIIIAHDLL